MKIEYIETLLKEYTESRDEIIKLNQEIKNIQRKIEMLRDRANHHKRLLLGSSLAQKYYTKDLLELIKTIKSYSVAG